CFGSRPSLRIRSCLSRAAAMNAVPALVRRTCSYAWRRRTRAGGLGPDGVAATTPERLPGGASLRRPSDLLCQRHQSIEYEPGSQARLATDSAFQALIVTMRLTNVPS